jgi:chloramphenicol O-acetyltransferase
MTQNTFITAAYNMSACLETTEFRNLMQDEMQLFASFVHNWTSVIPMKRQN